MNFPTVSTLNVVKKSFENSFVFTILPFGSVTVSLRVTFAESGSKCNAVDIGREMSLICNVAFIVSEVQQLLDR